MPTISMKMWSQNIFKFAWTISSVHGMLFLCRLKMPCVCYLIISLKQQREPHYAENVTVVISILVICSCFWTSLESPTCILDDLWTHDSSRVLAASYTAPGAEWQRAELKHVNHFVFRFQTVSNKFQISLQRKRWIQLNNRNNCWRRRW